jgi:hypothetical protein
MSFGVRFFWLTLLVWPAHESLAALTSFSRTGTDDGDEDDNLTTTEVSADVSSAVQARSIQNEDPAQPSLATAASSLAVPSKEFPAVPTPTQSTVSPPNPNAHPAEASSDPPLQGSKRWQRVAKSVPRAQLSKDTISGAPVRDNTSDDFVESWESWVTEVD